MILILALLLKIPKFYCKIEAVFFLLNHNYVNHLELNKRTFHTLNLAMLLNDGTSYLVYGTIGRGGQLQT